MTHLLPPNLLRLFAPRPSIPYLKPIARDPEIPLHKRLDGVAAFLEEVREAEALREAETEAQRDAEQKATKESAMQVEGQPESSKVKEQDKKPKKEDGEMEEGEEPAKAPELPAGEASVQKGEDGTLVDDSGKAFTYTEAEKSRQLALERKRRREETFKEHQEKYKPQDDADIVGDPYKTLFISRLSYQATEEDLRREFSMYGPIERIVVVRAKSGKKRGHSRGYAFILYEREKDMKEAYKDANNLKILGRRILVDVERGRTVKGWKPRRLGGGLGGRAKPPPAEFTPPSFGGGGRGGFGGGRVGGRGGFSSRGGGGFGGGGGFRDSGSRFGGGGPPSSGPGGPGGPRGGGIGYQSGGGGGFRDSRDSRGPPGGGGGFNQKDIIGTSGGGWGSRSGGGGGPPSDGYSSRGGQSYDSGSSAFEVPRQPMSGGPPQSSSGSYGSRGGYNDYPPEKRPRY